MVSCKAVNIVLATLGLLICVYTVYVEYRMEEKGYKPLCDISSISASCSKVFSSKYGRGLGLFSADSPLSIPNGLYGVVGYTVLILLSLLPRLHLVFLVAVISFSGVSVYMVYLLYVVLQDFCVVCTSLHVVNALLLVSAVISSCCGHGKKKGKRE